MLMTRTKVAAISTVMFGAIRQKGSARSLFAALFALALALRVVVPSGFMPVQTAQGIVVTICDGMASGKTMVIDLQRSDDSEHPSDHHKQPAPCAFAGLSAPVLAGGLPPVLALPALPLREIALPPPVSRAPVSADFLTPPLRGPPALA
ncbi:DUF2946 family protein [Sphingomonas sp. 37zxx]|uniref:DUF2946 family protein n=1 Tax=Sphingomonas sp. 37zxx TaxID=1550073 RepID=UPI001E3F69B4|nr:DUF2946 family protein [Sphingomonas sp. 37zxx]